MSQRRENIDVSDSKSLVRKPNAMIQAGQSLTALQSKILFKMLSEFRQQVSVRDSIDNVTYDIPYSSIIPGFESAKGGETYKRIVRQTRELLRQVLEVKQGNKTLMYNLVSRAEIVEGGSFMRLSFNKDVAPLLYNMHIEGYTKISFSEVFLLKSTYSIRTYEMLQQRYFQSDIKDNGWKVSMADFRFMLGMPSDLYPVFKDFRRRVLESARDEIQEKTDFRYDLEYIRSGRKYEYIYFKNISKITRIPSTIKTKKGVEPDADIEQTTFAPVDTPPESSPLDHLLPASRKEIAEKHSPEYIEHYYNKCRMLEAEGKIKTSFASLFYTYLKNDGDKFYEISARAEQEEKRKRASKAEAKKREKEEAIERSKKEKEGKERLERALELFDSLPVDTQQQMIEDQRSIKFFMSDESLREISALEYLDSQNLS